MCNFRFNSKARTLRPLVLNLSKVNYSSLNYSSNGQGNRNGFHRRLLEHPQSSNGRAPYLNTYRAYGMLVARVLRGALKLRYLVLGGTIGGGAALSNVSTMMRSSPVIMLAKYLSANVYRNTSNGRKDSLTWNGWTRCFRTATSGINSPKVWWRWAPRSRTAFKWILG